MFNKADGGKTRLELIDPTFIMGLGKVLTFGADKYDAHNWKKASKAADIERIKGAQLRHIMSYNGGELVDPETGLSHQYHIACNAMFLAYHEARSK